MQRMAALYKVIMQYILTIAGITISADVPYHLHPNESTASFIRSAENPEPSDLSLEFLPVEKLPKRSDVRYKESRRIYVGEGDDAGTYFSCHPDAPPYAFVSRHTVRSGVLRCEYLPGNEKYMDYARNLITLMDIEATLLDFDAIILHSSLIRYDGYGIIFSAPSGTGKSTQAELWELYERAEILNGDRAALRQIDNIWTAFGLPYAGTSGIYRNESAPLKAIVALRQAKENRIRRIYGAEAFRYLYPETMIHRWDPDFERRAAEHLLKLIADMPVFLLECRPDRGGVDILKMEIQSMI